MKLMMRLLGLFFGVLMLGNVAYAQTPREELRQMVEQLQTSPNDNALREKIIKLAATLKPALVIPEEAERHMAYGTAAFTGAKAVADYAEAAKEFELVTLAAPWVGDAYFNLGVAQDKAENYEAALRSLNLARLASPESKDIRALIYQIEYRNKKAQTIKEEAAKQEQAAAAERKKGEGGLTWMSENDGPKTWSYANAYCTNTAINGQTGWRLPTKNELSALYNYRAMNGDRLIGNTWSSTSNGAGNHYVVYVRDGIVYLYDEESNDGYVSCVR